MLGAFCGDIVGSIYEWDNIYTKDFQFFGEDRHGRGCYFTDDSIMTAACGSALVNGMGGGYDFAHHYRELGQQYTNAGWGSMFRKWLFSENMGAYNSFGNGSAMRVSPCAWFGNSLQEVLDLAKMSAEVSHNHHEGIKGAMAVAECIYLARMAIGDPKIKIRNDMRSRYYPQFNWDTNCNKIRPHYRFDETCQGTVPQAIIAYLDSTSFEDAVRNAISLGGDSDTLACITASIAEAEYGIPNWIKDGVFVRLDKNMKNVFDQFVGACDGYRENLEKDA